MESGEIRFPCGENLLIETLGTQSGLGLGKLQRVRIKADDMPARSDEREKAPCVPAEAQCAIKSDISGTGIQNLENFLDHDWHMAAGRSLARSENTGKGFGISREFLVFLIKPSRVFAGVARPATVRGLFAQSSLYFLFDPRDFETEYRSSFRANFARIAAPRST